MIDNFKVKTALFNCGSFNTLESELVNILEKKKIKYYTCAKELNTSNYKLKFLNMNIYSNENNNSLVIYLNYNNYKYLFMGDAGIEREKEILKRYNLGNVDFFKVGHHGSDTSSSKDFISGIKPKYSIISVGKNNKYGHPKKVVLDTLNESTVFRTDLNGSIEIKLSKIGYKIKFCTS